MPEFYRKARLVGQESKERLEPISGESQERRKLGEDAGELLGLCKRFHGFEELVQVRFDSASTVKRLLMGDGLR